MLDFAYFTPIVHIEQKINLHIYWSIDSFSLSVFQSLQEIASSSIQKNYAELEEEEEFTEKNVLEYLNGEVEAMTDYLNKGA